MYTILAIALRWIADPAHAPRRTANPLPSVLALIIAAIVLLFVMRAIFSPHAHEY